MRAILLAGSDRVHSPHANLREPNKTTAMIDHSDAKNRLADEMNVATPARDLSPFSCSSMSDSMCGAISFALSCSDIEWSVETDLNIASMVLRVVR